MKTYRTCPFLILDDLGAEKFTEWVAEAVYDLIDHRYAWMKPTIITSNLDPVRLSELFGARLASRISSGRVVHLTGRDRRLIGREGR